MTHRTRRLIFWGLVIIFLIVTPIILLYGLGYSFDWQKKTLVKTGAFYLKTNPAYAKIYINDNSKGRTNKYIKRLTPKEYNVAIKKNGFHTWEKQLKIESQIVTEARNILLVPEDPNIEVIAENLLENFSLEDFLLTDPKKQILDQASTTASKILKADFYQVINSYIYYLQPSDNILYRANLDGSNKTQISLEPLPADIYKIAISPNQNFFAILGKTGRLFFRDNEKKIFEKIAENIKDIEFSGDSKKLLYYTDSEIFVMYLEKILIQPYKEAGQIDMITRFSEKINTAIWYPETNEHIIFIVGDTIKMIELDDRDKRNIADFVKMESFPAGSWDKKPTAYSQNKERLYFINASKLYTAKIKSGGLW